MALRFTCFLFRSGLSISTSKGRGANLIPTNVLESFRGRTALVTGGTGLIGRQVVRLLCDAGSNVTIASLDHLEVDARAEHVYGDLTDYAFCKQTTREMEYVFHIAGIKGSLQVTKARPASFFVPLLMMNTNVLEACR
ncbi:MAG: NAD(P)-dependent oxidoreductase, partial [Acidimicrobiia bacterium]|nr:NAD(P)-dependent oxidoreductase [Acidimicrobiia bacterium]